MTARTGIDDAGRPEISAIIVPSGTAGFHRRPPGTEGRMERPDNPRVTFFDDAVPVTNLVGSGSRVRPVPAHPGRGTDRHCGALAVGSIPGQADERRLRQQSTGLRSLHRPQPVNRLQDRRHGGPERRSTGVLRGRRPAVRGEPFGHQAAIAKLVATEDAVTNARGSDPDLFGGYGFMERENRGPVLVDSKVLEVGEAPARCKADADRPPGASSSPRCWCGECRTCAVSAAPAG